jgi:hypothetical protein
MCSDPPRHPGIRIDKISVKSWAGLVFTIWVIVYFLIVLPPLRWFFILMLPAGILVGVVLYLFHRR